MTGLASAYVPLGGGWCGCSATCSDCSAALNNNTAACSIGVIADGAPITTIAAECINSNFIPNINGKTFDLNGSSLIHVGLFTSPECGVLLNTTLMVNITNGTISGWWRDIYVNTSLANTVDSVILQNSLYGMQFTGGAGHTIYNVTVSGASISAIDFWDDYSNFDSIYIHDNAMGLAVYGSNNQFNTILTHSHTGLGNGYGLACDGSTTGAQNNHFSNVVSYNNTEDGVFFSQCNHSSLTNVTSYNNTQYGIRLTTSSNNNLTSNNAYNNSQYGIVITTSSNNNLTSNNAYNNTRSGIRVATSSNNTLYNNTVYTNEYGIVVVGSSSNNTLTSNNAYNNSKSGISLTISSNNTLYNNTAYSNDDHGIYIVASSDNNLTSNTAYNNTHSGIEFTGFCLDNNITNSTFYDNGEYGIEAVDSEVYLVDTVFYNNGLYDAYFGIPTAFQVSIELFNVSFLNPTGTWENYTRFSMVDTLHWLEAYSINWTTNSIASPTDCVSFRQKWINISTQAGSPIITNATWHWYESELSGYVESNFRLFKYNASAGWTMLNDTPDISNNEFTYYLFNPASDYGILQNISICPVITSAGAYQLQADLVGAPNAVTAYDTSTACVVIAASDVDLDCNGYAITNNGTSLAAGVIVNGSTSLDYTNITIRNCPGVSGYQHGLYIYNSTKDYARNVTAYNNSRWGFYFKNSPNNSLTDSISYNNSIGLNFDASHNNTIYNFTAYNNSNHGLSISGDNNTILRSAAYNNLYGFTVTLFAENNNLTGNRAYNNSDMGFRIEGDNATLMDNLAYDNTNEGFYFAANMPTIINNSAYNNSKDGFFLGIWYYNALLTNNRAYNNSDNGFYLSCSHHATLRNNIAYNNTQYGVYFVFTHNSTLSNNRAYNNSLDGFQFFHSANNSLSNNSAYENIGNGFTLYNCSGHNLTNNSAHDNRVRGIELSYSDNAIVNRTVLYGNGQWDIYVYNVGLVPPFSYMLQDMLFLNPAGTMKNYTNLSISDTIATGEAYSVSWTTNSTALFDHIISFEQKFVNITTQAGTPSIDELIWHWNAGEVAGYTPADFKLMEYKGTTWSIMNSTPDTGARTLSLYNLDPASDYGILQFNENLTIDKTVLNPQPEYVSGDMVEFQLVVNNTGNTSFFNAEVYDELPVDLTFNATDTTPYTLNGQIINWSFASIAPNTDLIILLNATVDTGATPGLHWNDANVTAASRLGTNFTNSSNASVQIEAPAIYVQKDVFPQGCYVGGDATYTLNITNTGSINLTISVNDTLPAGIVFLESSPPNTSSSGQTIYWTNIELNLTPGNSTIIVYNVTTTTSGNLWNDVQVMGEYATGNVTASNSTRLDVKSTGGGGDGDEDLEIEVSKPAYVGGEVTITVTSDGNPINAHVKVYYPGSSKWYYPADTGSDGETSFVPEYEGNHNAIAEKSGFNDDNEWFDVLASVECMIDSDCTDVYGDCYVCKIHRDPADNQCVLKDGAECGYKDDCPSGYTCKSCECVSTSEPECEIDEDCPPGWECIDEECVEIEECTTDEDCPDEQFCADGSCIEVPCPCGVVTNHECISYECCADEDCLELYGEGYFCNLELNSCEEIPEEEPGEKPMDVDVPEDADAGDDVEVKVTSEGDPLGGADVVVYLGDEAYAEGITDPNGQIAFTAGKPGEYTVVVTKPGFASAEDSFIATSEEPSLWESVITGVWILSFILILIAIIYVLFTKKKKGRPKA